MLCAEGDGTGTGNVMRIVACITSYVVRASDPGFSGRAVSSNAFSTQLWKGTG